MSSQDPEHNFTVTPDNNTITHSIVKDQDQNENHPIIINSGSIEQVSPELNQLDLLSSFNDLQSVSNPEKSLENTQLKLSSTKGKQAFDKLEPISTIVQADESIKIDNQINKKLSEAAITKNTIPSVNQNSENDDKSLKNAQTKTKQETLPQAIIKQNMPTQDSIPVDLHSKPAIILQQPILTDHTGTEESLLTTTYDAPTVNSNLENDNAFWNDPSAQQPSSSLKSTPIQTDLVQEPVAMNLNSTPSIIEQSDLTSPVKTTSLTNHKEEETKLPEIQQHQGLDVVNDQISKTAEPGEEKISSHTPQILNIQKDVATDSLFEDDGTSFLDELKAQPVTDDPIQEAQVFTSEPITLTGKSVEASTFTQEVNDLVVTKQSDEELFSNLDFTATTFPVQGQEPGDDFLNSLSFTETPSLIQHHASISPPAQVQQVQDSGKDFYNDLSSAPTPLQQNESTGQTSLPVQDKQNQVREVKDEQVKDEQVKDEQTQVEDSGEEDFFSNLSSAPTPLQHNESTGQTSLPVQDPDVQGSGVDFFSNLNSTKIQSLTQNHEYTAESSAPVQSQPLQVPFTKAVNQVEQNDVNNLFDDAQGNDDFLKELSQPIIEQEPQEVKKDGLDDLFGGSVDEDSFLDELALDSNKYNETVVQHEYQQLPTDTPAKSSDTIPGDSLSFLEDDDLLLDDILDDELLEDDLQLSTDAAQPVNRYAPAAQSNNTNYVNTAPQNNVNGYSKLGLSQNASMGYSAKPASFVNESSVRNQKLIKKLQEEKKKSDAYDFPTALLSKHKPQNTKPVVANNIYSQLEHQITSKATNTNTAISGPPPMKPPINPYASDNLPRSGSISFAQPAQQQQQQQLGLQIPLPPLAGGQIKSPYTSKSNIAPPERSSPYAPQSALQQSVNSPYAPKNVGPPSRVITPYGSQMPSAPQPQTNLYAPQNHAVPPARVNSPYSPQINKGSSPVNSLYVPQQRNVSATQMNSPYAPTNVSVHSPYAPSNANIKPSPYTPGNAGVSNLLQNQVQHHSRHPSTIISNKHARPQVRTLDSVLGNDLKPDISSPNTGNRSRKNTLPPRGKGSLNSSSLRVQSPGAYALPAYHSAPAPAVVNPELLNRRQWPLFSFSSTGVCSCLIPSADGYGHNTTTITVTDIFKIIPEDKIVKSFPGPLQKNKTKVTDLDKWISSKLNSIGSDGENFITAEQMIWGVLGVMVREVHKLGDFTSNQNYVKNVVKVLNPSLIIKDNLDETVDIITLSRIMHQPPTTSQFNASSLSGSDLIRVHNLLLEGDKLTALHLSLSQRDWAMSFLIANIISPACFDEIINMYVANSFDSNDSIQKNLGFFLQFTNDGIDLNHFTGKEQWLVENYKTVIPFILLNNNKAGNVLMKLGTILLKAGYREYAYLSYFLSGLPLIPENPQQLSVDIDTLMMSEIYEFVLLSSMNVPANFSNGFPHMLGGKIIHAHWLADMGMVADAKRYSDFTGSVMKSKQIFFEPVVGLSQDYLIARLSGVSVGDQSWFGGSLKNKVWGTLDKSFNKFVSGEEQTEEQTVPKDGIFSKYSSPTVSRASSHINLNQAFNTSHNATPLRANPYANLPGMNPPTAPNNQAIISRKPSFAYSPLLSSATLLAGSSDHKISQYALQQPPKPQAQSTSVGGGGSGSPGPSYLSSASLHSTPPPQESTSFTPLAAPPSAPFAAHPRSHSHSQEPKKSPYTPHRPLGHITKPKAGNPYAMNSAVSENNPPLVRETSKTNLYVPSTILPFETVESKALAPISSVSSSLNEPSNNATHEISKPGYHGKYTPLSSPPILKDGQDVDHTSSYQFPSNVPSLVSKTSPQNVHQSQAMSTSKNTSKYAPLQTEPLESPTKSNDIYGHIDSSLNPVIANNTIQNDPVTSTFLTPSSPEKSPHTVYQPLATKPNANTDDPHAALNESVETPSVEQNSRRSSIDLQLEPINSTIKEKAEHEIKEEVEKEFVGEDEKEVEPVHQVLQEIKSQLVEESSVTTAAPIEASHISSRNGYNAPFNPYAAVERSNSPVTSKKAFNPYATIGGSRPAQRKRASNPYTPSQSAVGNTTTTNTNTVSTPNISTGAGLANKYSTVGATANPYSSIASSSASGNPYSYTEFPLASTDSSEITESNSQQQQQQEQQQEQQPYDNTHGGAHLTNMFIPPTENDDDYTLGSTATKSTVNRGHGRKMSVFATSDQRRYVADDTEEYYDDIVDDDDDVISINEKAKKVNEMKKSEKDARKKKEEEEAAARVAAEDKKKEEEKKKKAAAAAAAGGAHGAGGKGWFGWLGKKNDDDSPKPIKAKLGEESSFYYDEKLKRWINKKAPVEEQIDSTPPPPPVKHSISTTPSSPYMTPGHGGLPPRDGSSAPPTRATSVPPIGAGSALKNASKIEDLLSMSSYRTQGTKKTRRGARRGYVDVMAQKQEQ